MKYVFQAQILQVKNSHSSDDLWDWFQAAQLLQDNGGSENIVDGHTIGSPKTKSID